MAPNDNNEFERKSSFLNKRLSPIDAHPKTKKIYKRPGRLKERIRYFEESILILDGWKKGSTFNSNGSVTGTENQKKSSSSRTKKVVTLNGFTKKQVVKLI